MARTVKDLTTVRSGRLEVVSYSQAVGNGRHLWLCRCDCGHLREVLGQSIVSGKSKSCGCLQREVASAGQRQRATTHGRSLSCEHKAWSHMRQRCLNARHPRFKDWGGRGITICERWSKFENFLADMGPRPEGTSLDRINNDGPYSPENCRWATPLVQVHNRRRRSA